MSGSILWGSLAYGFSSSGKAQDENITISIAQDYIKQNHYDQAYNILKDYEENSKDVTEKTYFLLSFVEIKKDRLNEAKAHLQKAIALDPKFHEAYFNLALINLEQNDLQASESKCQQGHPS